MPQMRIGTIEKSVTAPPRGAYHTLIMERTVASATIMAHSQRTLTCCCRFKTTHPFVFGKFGKSDRSADFLPKTAFSRVKDKKTTVIPWNDTNQFEKKRKTLFFRKYDNLPTAELPASGSGVRRALPSQPFGSPDYIFDTKIIHPKRKKVKSYFYSNFI